MISAKDLERLLLIQRCTGTIYKDNIMLHNSKGELISIIRSDGCCLNRKIRNDQESIQLPNTFRPRHQKE